MRMKNKNLPDDLCNLYFFFSSSSPFGMSLEAEERNKTGPHNLLMHEISIIVDSISSMRHLYYTEKVNLRWERSCHLDHDTLQIIYATAKGTLQIWTNHLY